MDYQIFIQFVVYIAIIVLLFFLKPFWNESAKKIVEKNNAEIITKITETVKAEINNETEKLKTFLNYSSQHSLNLIIDEKNALYEFNKSISKTLKKSGLYSTDFYNVIEKYEESNEIIKQQFEDYTEKLSHLFLFIRDDKEIMKLIREYSIDLHNLKSESNRFILNNFYVKQIKTLNHDNHNYFSKKFNELIELTDTKYTILSKQHDLIRENIYFRLNDMRKKFQ